jgi:hypothetical protein
MKPLGLISQMVAIGLAVAIVAFFVRPIFIEIGDTQTEIQKYVAERVRVTETNQTLAARVSEVEAISTNDRLRLMTYVPPLLDKVAVLRDIEIIAKNAEVNYSAIQYNGELIDTSDEARLSQIEAAPISHNFSITVDGRYNSIKNFFSLLEQNKYPLQVYSLEIRPQDAGFLTADMTIVTYITNPDPE